MEKLKKMWGEPIIRWSVIFVSLVLFVFFVPRPRFFLGIMVGLIVLYREDLNEIKTCATVLWDVGEGLVVGVINFVKKLAETIEEIFSEEDVCVKDSHGATQETDADEGVAGLKSSQTGGLLKSEMVDDVFLPNTVLSTKNKDEPLDSEKIVDEILNSANDLLGDEEVSVAKVVEERLGFAAPEIRPLGNSDKEILASNEESGSEIGLHLDGEGELVVPDGPDETAESDELVHAGSDHE